MQHLGKNIRHLLAISLVVGTLGILLNLYSFLPLLRVENFTRDLRSVLGRKTPVATDIVLLTIDDDSLRLDGLMDDEVETSPIFGKMREGWPWPRSVHAALLEKLCQAGARVVAFDLLFPGPGPGDEEFAAALRKYADRAVVAATFDGTDTARPSFSRPTATLLEPGKTDSQIGFANFVPDSDGVVRAALFHASPEDFLRRKYTDNHASFDSLAARILKIISPEIELPYGVNIPFRFSGMPGAYTHHPLYEIFIPALWEQNYQSGRFFKDKIVVIGPDGGWSHDEHPTPFSTSLLGAGGLMSGPEIHLQALAAARLGEFLHLPGAFAVSGIIALAACLGGLISWLRLAPWKQMIGSCLMIVAYWFTAQWIYNENGWLLPVAAPVLVLAVTVFAGFLVEFSRERFERLRSRSTLERYVSRDVAREILDHPQSYLTSLVGIKKSVTVLFTDLKNFTALVNLLDAQELVTQLNEFYARAIEDVFDHGGTLDKIMGDGMMAVWGNLRTDGPQADAANAVRTALAIQRSLEALNQQWVARGRPALALGIGIAHGECIVGNIGSIRKMDLTVIGEAANLAARLQALTREYKENLLFDSEVADLVSSDIPVTHVGMATIRGFEHPVQLHTA